MATDPDFTHLNYQRGKETLLFTSTVPQKYLLGVGAVITNWGLFEMAFDNFIAILRWDPKAVARYPKVPLAFYRRAKLLRQSGALVLPKAPTIVACLTAISADAIKLGRKRNDVTHSHWFETEGQMVIYRGLDATKPRYVVTEGDLFFLATRISQLHERLVLLQMCYIDPGDPSIPATERNALRVHFENKRPNPSGPVQFLKPEPFLPD